jgi:hypothetical protein
MPSISKKGQESLAVLELANRQLREDLTLALELISKKKQTFSKLGKHEAKKRALFEIFDEIQTTIHNKETVRC